MRWSAFALLSAVAMTSCSSDNGSDATPYLVLQQPDVGQMDAPLDAVVSIEDDCVLLRYTGGDRVARAFWPDGTTYDPDRNFLILADGTELPDRSRVIGGGGAEISLDDMNGEIMGRVFVESTFTEFTRTCRSGEVTADRVLTVGSVRSARPADD